MSRSTLRDQAERQKEVSTRRFSPELDLGAVHDAVKLMGQVHSTIASLNISEASKCKILSEGKMKAGRASGGVGHLDLANCSTC